MFEIKSMWALYNGCCWISAYYCETVNSTKVESGSVYNEQVYSSLYKLLYHICPLLEETEIHRDSAPNHWMMDYKV